MVRLLADIVRKLYPYGVFRVGTGLAAKRSGEKIAYLTFDDGPIPEVTPQVLAILDHYQIKATFFMVGENIDKHPDVFRQVVEAGHTIGNHTYNHLNGFYWSKEEYFANVAKCEKAIFTHHPSPYVATLFRPPYGKATLAQRYALHREGYQIIYWDILTRDYSPAISPNFMLQRIKRMARPGTIINFHDSLKSNERMLEALPQAIEWLIEQGYTFRALG